MIKPIKAIEQKNKGNYSNYQILEFLNTQHLFYWISFATTNAHSICHIILAYIINLNQIPSDCESVVDDNFRLVNEQKLPIYMR